MNALRRILLIIYSLLLLAAVGALGVLAWNQDEQLDLDIGDLNLQALVTSGDTAKWIFTGVLAAIGLFALVTLLIALWPRRAGRRGAMRIRQSDGGTVEVTPSAVEAILKDELEALPEIQSAKPRVALSGGAVDTYLDAQIEPSANIANTTRLIGSTVEEVLRDQLGVSAVRKPTVRISYDEMAARPVPTRRPRPAPATGPELRPQRESPVYPNDPDPEREANRPAEAPRFVSSEDEESRDA